MKKVFHSLFMACALIAGFTGTASADYLSHSGNSVGKPEWDVTPFNRSGTVVPYDVFEFKVDTDGDYKVLASGGFGFDLMLILYEGSFDPNAPLTNVTAFSDDLFVPKTAGFVDHLTAGVKYSLVITGTNDGIAGDYIVTLGGPGKISAVSAVPEPSAWLMLGGGLALLGCVQRRRKQSAAQPA